MEDHNIKEIIRDKYSFLSRPYEGVTCEYTSGCRIFSEIYTEEKDPIQITPLSRQSQAIAIKEELKF